MTPSRWIVAETLVAAVATVVARLRGNGVGPAGTVATAMALV